MPPAILFGTTLLALYFREDVAAEDRIHIYAALDERSRQVRGLQPSSVTIAAIARTEAMFSDFGLGWSTAIVSRSMSASLRRTGNRQP